MPATVDEVGLLSPLVRLLPGVLPWVARAAAAALDDLVGGMGASGGRGS
jgi:hypothetical protein